MQTVRSARGHAAADGRREAEAHRAEPLAVEHPHAGRNAERLHRHFARCAGTARHQQIARPHLVGKHLDQHVIADALGIVPVFRQEDGESGLPLAALGPPCVAVFGDDPVALGEHAP